ncbi:alpha amylase C-terminal domain-containing protein, partial [Streptomyces shenzhenensis]|uniref:alpha amylase C-terminal domain-containing protein n=1 Tax=Streptomyces shenzhenensis TaxID=943815 RepID=UPI0036B3C577
TVRHDYRLGVPDDIPAWHEALNTDNARYGGSNVTGRGLAVPHDGHLRVTLPPLATVWLVPAPAV